MLAQQYQLVTYQRTFAQKMFFLILHSNELKLSQNPNL